MKHVSGKSLLRIMILAGIFNFLYVAVLGGIAAWQLGMVAAGSATAASATTVILIATVVLGVICLASFVMVNRMSRRFIHWFEGILDSIPFPVSVTDMDGKWTFLNRPVEEMLSVKRSDMLGKPCSSWGAAICGTADCGMECLKGGRTRTTFEQGEGDFQVDVAYLTGTDGRQIGHVEVVQDITAMVQTQKAQTRLVEEISNLCESFVSASGNISDGAQSLAQGSMEQASSVEELSSFVGDVATKTEHNAEMADQAAALAQNIQTSAQRGSEQMSRMAAAVEDIRSASHSISNVIKVIDDIAFQTNILALNAAVEAARAGQHGKGFAVVADEVRSLAAKSAEAAQNTSSLIENSIKKAELGVQISSDTSESLSEIVEGIVESTGIMGEIAQSSREQNTAIAQINAGLEQVAAVVQTNSATAQQSAAASEELNSQTNMLQGLLNEFGQQTGAGARRALPQ